MNWNDEINDIIREALQILKQRQEAAQQQADIERMLKALQMVVAQPGFEPEEPYGQAVLGALMSRINYTPNNEEM